MNKPTPPETPSRFRCATTALWLAPSLLLVNALADDVTRTDSPPLQLAPVVVTSDLWGTPADALAASVTVFDATRFEQTGIRHFADLVDLTPNLTFSGGTSRPRYLQIRGVGENSQYEGETPDSSVRFLVDDFDVTGLGTLAGTFDLDQVEILRGPQAGAFGANAAGGVVRMVTAAPTPHWTGRIEGTGGNDGLAEGGFAIGGPLIESDPEQLMMRFALHRHVSHGFRRNVFLGRNTNARDELMARLRLTWNPSEVWRWDFAALFSDVDNGFDEFALDNNGRRTFSDQPGRDEQRTRALSLRGTNERPGGVRFTTVSAATWADSLYSYDDDWTSASYEGFSELIRDRFVFNQELRLDGESDGWIERWTLGLFFSELREDGAYTNEDPGNIRGLETDYRASTQAIFGQVGREIAPRTRAILGLRAERVDVRGDGLRTRFRKGPATFDPEVTLNPRFDDTMWGGKVTLEHDLAERRMLFASVARGYKAGGVNNDARINPGAGDPLTYETETLWNYEVGLRASTLNNRLRGELTAFYLDRRDTQVRDSAGFGGNYRFFTDNANQARVFGLEAAGEAGLTEEVTLYGSLGLMDSHLSTFTLSNGNTGGGRRLANTPRYGYTLGVRYASVDNGWFGNFEAVGQDRQFDSNNHTEARRAYTVFNGAFGYTMDRWTFTAWGRNLFNETYDQRVFFFGNEEPAFIPTRYESRAAPRSFGLTAAYRF